VDIPRRIPWDQVAIYNEASVPIADGRHPWLLCAKAVMRFRLRDGEGLG
jgi:hypothetical protein